jgi:UDP-N-acetylmuramyl pentapeptide phosphotransferase/UDP-N-acetylglucosamine-1-phosphate transferase
MLKARDNRFRQFLMLLAVLAAASAALVYGLTGAVLRLLLRRGVLDEPTARSSHTNPTPRGGGLAVLGGAIPCLGAAALATGAGTELLLPALGLALVACVSFYDDLRGASARLRFGTQMLAVALGLAALPDGARVFQGFLPFWADRLAAGFAWLWFVNLYNFMDGIDGITAVETLVIGLGLALVAALAPPRPFPVAAGLVLAGAAIGFLPWNWAKARIFLGDVGSVPLGYMLGFLLLDLAAAGRWAAALALPLYYVADATLTLLGRMARGEKVWQAHRSHAYQKAAARAGHAAVSLSVGAAGALLIAAALAAEAVSPAFLVAAAGVVAALLVRLARLARPARAGPGAH